MYSLKKDYTYFHYICSANYFITIWYSFSCIFDCDIFIKNINYNAMIIVSYNSKFWSKIHYYIFYFLMIYICNFACYSDRTYSKSAKRGTAIENINSICFLCLVKHIFEFWHLQWFGAIHKRRHQSRVSGCCQKMILLYKLI